MGVRILVQSEEEETTVWLVNMRTTSTATRLEYVFINPTDVMDTHIPIAEEMTKSWMIVTKSITRQEL